MPTEISVMTELFSLFYPLSPIEASDYEINYNSKGAMPFDGDFIRNIKMECELIGQLCINIPFYTHKWHFVKTTKTLNKSTKHTVLSALRRPCTIVVGPKQMEIKVHL